MEAIRLHVEKKWTYQQINDHLGIQEIHKFLQPKTTTV